MFLELSKLIFWKTKTCAIMNYQIYILRIIPRNIIWENIIYRVETHNLENEVESFYIIKIVNNQPEISYLLIMLVEIYIYIYKFNYLSFHSSSFVSI